MAWIRMLVASSFIVAVPAHGQWLPAWIGTWQHDVKPAGVSPVGVRLGSAGRIFALLETAHDGQGHTALARFDEGGSFAWLRERASAFRIDARVLADDRVAVVDQFGAGLRVRVYDADGGIAWEDATQPGQLAAGPRRLAVGSDGSLFIGTVDGDDFAVVRYDAHGQVLPAWRWSPGPEDLQVDDIVATTDGGVVLGGAGDPFSGGVFVVRFDAAGKVRFADRELGDHGTTHLLDSLVSVGIDGHGNVVAVAALENAMGVVQAQAWKIAPDGMRLWTRRLESPGNPLNQVRVGGFALDAAGHALVVTDFGLGGPFRVLRADAASGAVLGVGEAILGGMPNGIALAPNGRMLVTGFHFIDGQGHVGARIAEFDDAMRPCRVADLDDRYFGVVAAGNAQGWTLAAGSLLQGVGNDADVLRFDAQGPCDSEAIFADGFEAAARDGWR